MVTPVISNPRTSEVSVERRGNTANTSAALDVKLGTDAWLEGAVDIIKVAPFDNGGQCNHPENKPADTRKDRVAHVRRILEGAAE